MNVLCIIHYKYFNRKQYADVSWSVLKERLNEFELGNIQRSKSTCTTSAGKKCFRHIVTILPQILHSPDVTDNQK